MKVLLSILVWALGLQLLVGCLGSSDEKAKTVDAPPVKVEKPSASVFFLQPKNGDTVPEEFQVIFGMKGMMIHPAGVNVEGTGHHHLIINGSPVPETAIIPMDEKHFHYGKGQTQAKIKLPKGKHKLTLQFANGVHASYGLQMSETISINVE